MTAWLAAAAEVLGAKVAFAAEVSTAAFDKPFEGTGSFVDWATWTTIAVAILILVILALTLLLRRRNPSPAAENLLLFSGLCVLPIFLMVVGVFATFEGSKTVAFCHSCHTAMDLYVDDMHDPKSETLAAKHYKNRYIQHDQCYTCHADYGVHGTAKAKITGLFHLYKWLTNSETAQGKEQIRMYGYGYPNTWCLNCHAGSQKFLAREEHQDWKESLVAPDPETGAPGFFCHTCHAPVHPSLESSAARDSGSVALCRSLARLLRG